MIGITRFNQGVGQLDRKKYDKDYFCENKQRLLILALKRRDGIAQKLEEYKKTLKCKDCSETDFRVMEFDHLGSDKVGNVADLVGSGWSWKAVLKEIEKCDPLCANCHRIRTYGRRLSGGGPVG